MLLPPLLQPDGAPTGLGAREIRRSSHSQLATNLTLSSNCRKNKSPSTLETPENHSGSAIRTLKEHSSDLPALGSAPIMQVGKLRHRDRQGTDWSHTKSQ